MKKYRELYSFVLVGGSTALLGLAIMYVLVDIAYWNPAVANATQLVVTFFVNYHLTKRFTWQIGGHDAFPRFLAARFASVLLTFLLFLGFSDIGLPYLWATVCSIAIATGVNFLVSKYWVFTVRADKPVDLESLRLGASTARTCLAMLALLLGGLLFVSPSMFVSNVLLGFALFALLLVILFAVSLLYTQRYHGADASQRLRPLQARTRERFAVLMPARHEVAVLPSTMVNTAWTQRHHPDYVMHPTVCHDDPETMRAVLRTARVINWWHRSGQPVGREELERRVRNELDGLTEQPAKTGRIVRLVAQLTATERIELEAMQAENSLVQPLEYYLDGRKPSKPLQLNYAFRLLGRRYTAYTILDAESLAAEGLLTHVDQAFQDDRSVDIIQGPVQLMDPRFTGSTWNRCKQYWRRWYAWQNMLEYSRWFKGQMKFQSDAGYVPLGGNTVFVRTELLEKTDGWPETLTEDCALGTLATAVHGAKTFTFYDPKLATREETPPRLGELVRQRVRWNQGFLQTFLSGQWRALPTMRQRMLALWILSMAFFQAISVSMLPVTLVTMFVVSSPVPYVLVMCLPIAVMALSTLLQVEQLRTFAVSFDRPIAWHVYLLMVASQFFYQPVLSYAALKAVFRHWKGDTSWHRTARSGDNLAPAQPQASYAS